MRIGYARVSTEDQRLDMQLDALRQSGCERIYQEHASGKNASRPQLESMLEILREGDTVVVCKLDRISRSVQDLEKLARRFEDTGVKFVSLSEQIDTSTSMGKFFFHITSSISDLERDIIVERTKAGLAEARARGRNGGRKAMEPKQVKKMLALYDSKTMRVCEVCEMMGVTKTTLYKYVNERKAKQEKAT